MDNWTAIYFSAIFMLGIWHIGNLLAEIRDAILNKDASNGKDDAHA